jgi:hypothetical protein
LIYAQYFSQQETLTAGILKLTSFFDQEEQITSVVFLASGGNEGEVVTRENVGTLGQQGDIVLQ